MLYIVSKLTVLAYVARYVANGDDMATPIGVHGP